MELEGAVFIPKKERHVFYGEVQSEFEWCLHCERAFKTGFRKIIPDHNTDANQYCPYPTCDGSAIDISYGELPEIGVRYPLT